MEIHFLDSINAIAAESWNSILPDAYPFIRHEFLATLENSESADKQSGWIPFHLIVKNNAGTLLALMPLYIKTHSWGEYVFDWSWANAYEQNGLNYYPKFTSAIPYTPATGPRICLREGENAYLIYQAIVHAVQQQANKLGVSSWHLLFPAEDLSQHFVKLGLPKRAATQFHWFNRDYKNFDDFLAVLSSRKRKNIKKEREKVTQQGIKHITYSGAEISRDNWQLFHHFYHMTYLKRSGRAGYLTKAFFFDIGTVMPEAIAMSIAYKNDDPIAAALFFRGDQTLYGRYWGCLEEYEFLHFETCYYQGIEYCIANGLQRFDAGAQGEHKIQRGFEPITTWSNHWIKHPGFRDAIENFLREETIQIENYRQSCEQHLPFKKNSS